MAKYVYDKMSMAKKNALHVAKDMYYPQKYLDMIEDAKTIGELNRVLRAGRKEVLG